MPRTLAALGFLASLMAFASGVEAASQKLWDTCAGKDTEAAIKVCTKILAGKENRGNQAAAHYNRAVAYGSKGDFGRAIGDATRAIELDPDKTLFLRFRAGAYFSSGNDDSAIADYTKAIELDPKDAMAFGDRGYSYFRKGLTDLAMAGYTRAIGLDPNFARPFNNRGFLYLQRGDYDAAIADFTRYIAIDQKYAGAYRHRADAYLKAGKLDLARADLDKALQLKPDDPEAKATLAELEQAEASPKAAIAPGGPTPSDAPSADLHQSAKAPMPAASPLDDDLSDLDKFDPNASTSVPAAPPSEDDFSDLDKLD